MSEQELTPWFPPEVKPVRDGVYLTRGIEFSHKGVLRFWNGTCWSWMNDYSNPAPFLAERQWRGLSKEPQ